MKKKRIPYAVRMSMPIWLLRDPNNVPSDDEFVAALNSFADYRRFKEKYYVDNPDVVGWEPPKYTRKELEGLSREELLEIYDEVGLGHLFGVNYESVGLDVLIDAIVEDSTAPFYRNLPEGALV